MNESDIQAGRRILVIDDNRAIHRDFRKILSSDLQSDTRLQERESVLFGDPAPACPRQHFQIDSAYDGEEGLRLLSQAVESGERYSVAFVDVRMGSG